MHSLTMADELRSFQYLDINKTQWIGHWNLEHSYGMTLTPRNKRNN